MQIASSDIYSVAGLIEKHSIRVRPETRELLRLVVPPFPGTVRGLLFLGTIRPLLTDGIVLWGLTSEDRLVDVHLDAFEQVVPSGHEGNLSKTPPSVDPLSSYFLASLTTALQPTK